MDEEDDSDLEDVFGNENGLGNDQLASGQALTALVQFRDPRTIIERPMTSWFVEDNGPQKNSLWIPGAVRQKFKDTIIVREKEKATIIAGII